MRWVRSTDSSRARSTPLSASPIRRSAYAGFHKTCNLIAIVDNNGVQLTGQTADVLNLEPWGDKFTSFGWQCLECDGHNITEVVETIARAKEMSKSGPTAIIAHTVKGKGISFMEGKYQWHGKAPNEEEREQALAEIHRWEGSR